MKSSTMAVAGLHKGFLVDLQLANSELWILDEPGSKQGAGNLQALKFDQSHHGGSQRENNIAFIKRKLSNPFPSRIKEKTHVQYILRSDKVNKHHIKIVFCTCSNLHLHAFLMKLVMMMGNIIR
jgi:hypothetical protein